MNNQIMNNLYNFRRRKAIIILIFCIFCFLVTLSCVVICLLETPSDLTPERGSKTFHLFTINSNLIFATGAVLCVPFAIEGLRKDRVHIPTWCLWYLFIGVTSVSLTFVFAVTLIFPFKGASLAFGGTNLFLHLICPILAIILFTVLASDHKMKFKETFIGMIFFVVYAVFYEINVLVIGEDNGGWRDIYQLNTKLPLYVAVPMMISLAFLIAFILRLLHNKTCKVAENNAIKQMKKYVKITDESKIEEVIEEVAHQVKVNPHIVNIPIDDLKEIAKLMNQEVTNQELCDMYITGYYNN